MLVLPSTCCSAVIGRPEASVVMYRSVTVSFSVTTDGVGAAWGAVHWTVAPLPANVPTSDDHAKVNSDTGVSASVTVADTVTVSSRSANCAGSRGFDPRATMDAMTGGVFATRSGATNVNPPGSVAGRPPEITTTSATPIACSGVTAVRLPGGF